MRFAHATFTSGVLFCHVNCCKTVVLSTTTGHPLSLQKTGRAGLVHKRRIHDSHKYGSFQFAAVTGETATNVSV
uniref:Putative secreted protein n=1 Tax=Ixodes ricinus TaxID=34613 RepID=A0A6B0U2Z9_IXORI